MNDESETSDGPLSCAELRRLDAAAIGTLGIPGIVLMENAARGAAEVILGMLRDPRAARAVILCGPGNNGGDGFAAARHLSNAGVEAVCILALARERYTGDAATNLRIIERLNLQIVDAVEALEQVAGALTVATVIVDALLGTGASGPPRGLIAELIRLANAAGGVRRVALDIPSGLDPDSGIVHEPCFRAGATVTFIAEKVGFGAPAAAAVLGRVVVAEIGVGRRFLAQLG